MSEGFSVIARRSILFLRARMRASLRSMIHVDPDDAAIDADYTGIVA